eukprot:805963-Rhodomonas_salina.1
MQLGLAFLCLGMVVVSYGFHGAARRITGSRLCQQALCHIAFIRMQPTVWFELVGVFMLGLWIVFLGVHVLVMALSDSRVARAGGLVFFENGCNETGGFWSA